MFSKRMKLVTVALSAILTAPAMMGAVTYRNSVRILDEGDHAKTILTQSSDPRVILEEAGIELGQYDTIEFVERAERVYHLKIDRAFDVAFDDGGTSRTVEMVEGETVADLLKKAGVTLGADDVITPALTETVTPETQVVLQRITYQTQTVNETIPYETIERHTPLLKDGKTRQLEAGSNGSQTRTSVYKYVNGQYAETVSETVEVTLEPVDEVVLYGNSQATVTTLEVPEDLALDANGNPVSYVRKITGKGTAYSAWDGAKTASGRYAIPGHVAVNPNVIPYGSKLYIKSSDGSFVYGYAVAADTGIALMDGRVTVDLYFDTYLESCLFGAKTMDIYVLE